MKFQFSYQPKFKSVRTLSVNWNNADEHVLGDEGKRSKNTRYLLKIIYR